MASLHILRWSRCCLSSTIFLQMLTTLWFLLKMFMFASFPNLRYHSHSILITCPRPERVVRRVASHPTQDVTSHALVPAPILWQGFVFTMACQNWGAIYSQSGFILYKLVLCIKGGKIHAGKINTGRKNATDNVFKKVIDVMWLKR